MERKLELKDIAGYLPNRLQSIEIDDESCIYDLTKISLFQGIFKVGICRQINNDFFDEGEICIEETTPILRPLSDLYKTTTHDGKAIIPIVELAKIAFPNKKFELERDKCPIACIRNDDGDIVSQFSYYEYFYFVEFSGYRTKPNMSINIKNQYKLFDYLNELKIDYRGLIDAGVAVSVYDLDNNPYK